MLNNSINITNFDAIQKQINIINSMKDTKSINEFLKDKFLRALNKVMESRLIAVTSGIGANTNAEYIEQYKRNNMFEDIDNGFILYNHTVIPQSELSISSSKNLANYPNGFSIALAFEYGTGIVGQNAPVTNAWEYNVNNYNFAWRFKKDDVWYSTYGYQGMEIYRYTVEEIKNNINDWIKEYYTKVVQK